MPTRDSVMQNEHNNSLKIKLFKLKNPKKQKYIPIQITDIFLKSPVFANKNEELIGFNTKNNTSIYNLGDYKTVEKLYNQNKDSFGLTPAQFKKRILEKKRDKNFFLYTGKYFEFTEPLKGVLTKKVRGKRFATKEEQRIIEYNIIKCFNDCIPSLKFKENDEVKLRSNQFKRLEYLSMREDIYKAFLDFLGLSYGTVMTIEDIKNKTIDNLLSNDGRVKISWN